MIAFYGYRAQGKRFKDIIEFPWEAKVKPISEGPKMSEQTKKSVLAKWDNEMKERHG